jgi:uncharacterized membrane protein YgcG
MSSPHPVKKQSKKVVVPRCQELDDLNDDLKAARGCVRQIQKEMEKLKAEKRAAALKEREKKKGAAYLQVLKREKTTSEGNEQSGSGSSSSSSSGGGMDPSSSSSSSNPFGNVSSTSIPSAIGSAQSKKSKKP